MPPKRQNVKKYSSESVQGDDSWVELRRTTLAEGMELRRAQRRASRLAVRSAVAESVADADDAEDLAEAAAEAELRKFLGQRVAAWNWVDDDGNPLPQPSEDVTVVDRLTDNEVAFLTECLRGPSAADTKSD